MIDLTNKVATRITLYADAINRNNPVSVYAKRKDAASRYLIVEIVGINGKIAIDGAAQLNATKPDGKRSFITGEIEPDNTIVIGLTDQLLAVEGTVSCDVSVFDAESNSVLTTATFYIIVGETHHDEEAIESENEYQGIALDSAVKAQESAAAAAGSAESAYNMSVEAANSAEASEKAAEESETYLEQIRTTYEASEAKAAESKKYSEDAEVSAQNADQSAQNASLSLSACETSESNASQHAADAEADAQRVEEMLAEVSEKLIATQESAAAAAGSADCAYQHANDASASAEEAIATVERANAVINDLLDDFYAHRDSTENPHQVTYEQVGAAPADHTHTPEEIGAAPTDHTHPYLSFEQIEATLPSSATWKSVTYGNGKFVAVASSSTTAAYSTDGITWTAATLPSSHSWYSVTYGNGKFVAVAGSSTTAALSRYGDVWTNIGGRLTQDGVDVTDIVRFAL